jgi:5-methylcytosine-specific restriction protein A
MTLGLSRACPVWGCPEVQPCQAHQRLADQRRGSAASRGYGYQWQRYSRSFRRRHPLCGDRPASAPDTRDSRCRSEHRIVASTVVDHIVPISGPTDPRFWDGSNHQSLCDACHNAKRRRERRS